MPINTKNEAPFNRLQAGAYHYLSADLLDEIRASIQRRTPVPNPDTYDWVKYQADGVHFGLMVDVDGSETKTAIVPALGGFLKFHCVERPEVIFEDVVSMDSHCISRNRWQALYILPEQWRASVELGTTRITSVVADCPVPVACRAVVKSTRLEIDMRPAWWRRWFGKVPSPRVTVRFEAVRRGFRGVRYQPASREEYEANEAFYSGQRPTASPPAPQAEAN